MGHPQRGEIRVTLRIECLPPAALMARAAEAAPPSTSLEVHGKQEEEEVDLDSSLIWAIRYLECDAVEEMLSEGANI